MVPPICGIIATILFYITFCISMKTSDVHYLQFAIIMHRHGDRSPVKSYKNDPYINCTWRGGLGALTPKGAARMYTLGTNLRSRYLSLLPPDGVYASDKLQVDSKSLERCLMSAQCVMAGLLPPPPSQNGLPILWQPVAIHAVQEENITLFPVQNCPKYRKMRLKFDQDPDPDTAVHNFYQEHANMLADLKVYTGENVSLITAALLHDTLSVQQENNLKLPAWTKLIGLDKLQKLRERLMAMRTETPYMKRIVAGPFIDDFLHKLTQKENGTLSQNLQIYSTSDDIIVDVMSALNMSSQVGYYVDFGATVVFELHRIGSKSIIKIVYYEHPEDAFPKQLSIPHCPQPCSLKKFKQLIQGIAIGPDEFHKICEVQ